MNSETLKELRLLIGRFIQANRGAISKESLIQDGLMAAFEQLGIEAVREHSLSKKSRLDFWLPEYGFVVELKKGTANKETLRQVGRYLEHPEVKGCVVVAVKCSYMPVEFIGKPIHCIELWKYLL